MRLNLIITISDDKIGRDELTIQFVQRLEQPKQERRHKKQFVGKRFQALSLLRLLLGTLQEMCLPDHFSLFHFLVEALMHHNPVNYMTRMSF